MILTCPNCGSRDVQASRSRTAWEEITKIAGFCPVRCHDCGHRSTKTLLWPDGIGHARCPKCYRTELTDWAEPYFYPPGHQRILLRFGAKGHRCSRCRVNFVSFFSRKQVLTGPTKSSASRDPGNSEAA